MNLLIVDDEPVIRIGLRTLVDWESHGLTLAAEANDGVEALRCIEEHDIDILVTDIRMPRMDGLELIRRARAIQSDLGVLVLSCLDDFVFVREAMKLGASDYMLKPAMEPEELVAALQTIRKQIAETRLAKLRLDDWHAQVEQTKQSKLNAWLAQLLRDGAKDERLEQELWSKPNYLYSIVVTCLESSELTPADLGLAECAASARFREHANLYLVPCLEAHSRMEQHTLRSRTVQQLKDKLDKLTADSGREWFVGVGPLVTSSDELVRAVALHARQLHHRFYQAGEPVMWEDAAGLRSSDSGMPYELRNDMLKAIANDNPEALFHRVEKFSEWLAEHQPPPERLHAFVFELISLSVGYARENGYGQLDDYERRFVSLERIRAFFQAGELCRWLSEAMRELWSCRFVSAVSLASNNPFVRKAVHFMKEHYRRNIGTLDIADHVKLSRSYLSDLYGKETGESLIETLTRIRIEEAKKRLLAGERKVYEIAEEVGFADPKSFAKTFKKLVGCSPKEYEAQNK
ncbi:response regulator [Paenibacillus sp. MBLB4367]|uniref:response regulator n=1 Tax=Paenibacillus sp. MBLB4367 TaxID=3384767 RepID=UPI0039082BD9